MSPEVCGYDFPLVPTRSKRDLSSKIGTKTRAEGLFQSQEGACRTFSREMQRPPRASQGLPKRPIPISKVPMSAW
jgi:hypothetical protein